MLVKTGTKDFELNPISHSIGRSKKSEDVFGRFYHLVWHYFHYAEKHKPELQSSLDPQENSRTPTAYACRMTKERMRREYNAASKKI